MKGLTVNFLGQAEAVDGPPSAEGVYVVEVYFGWKILEWQEGEWWHTQKVGRWTASSPLQWLGPLPELMGQKGAKTPDKVYDL